MKAGFSIKSILYFAPNCPQKIVAPNCPTSNCPRRIVRAELSAPNCPTPNCPRRIVLRRIVREPSISLTNPLGATQNNMHRNLFTNSTTDINLSFTKPPSAAYDTRYSPQILNKTISINQDDETH